MHPPRVEVCRVGGSGFGVFGCCYQAQKGEALVTEGRFDTCASEMKTPIAAVATVSGLSPQTRQWLLFLHPGYAILAGNQASNGFSES